MPQPVARRKEELIATSPTDLEKPESAALDKRQGEEDDDRYKRMFIASSRGVHPWLKPEELYVNARLHCAIRPQNCAFVTPRIHLAVT
jgi:hypothetical protein